VIKNSVLLIALVTSGIGCNPFRSEVDALLSESGAEYKIIGCSGGSRERKMSCEIDISPQEVEKLIQGLGLNTPLPGVESQSRIVYLSEGRDIRDSELEKAIDRAFGYQLWNPSRHGFAGAFLLYYPNKKRGRLWLSIAYG